MAKRPVWSNENAVNLIKLFSDPDVIDDVEEHEAKEVHLVQNFGNERGSCVVLEKGKL